MNPEIFATARTATPAPERGIDWVKLWYWAIALTLNFAAWAGLLALVL